MPVTKDYYKILNVKPSATQGEIKNAYRRLALKYHPDHNPHDALATAVFSEAAEAYKTLSNAEARKQYNEKRFITAEQEYNRPAETIESLLYRIHEINRQVKISDPFRFNKDALLYSINQLLPENILILDSNNAMTTEFLEAVCIAVSYLDVFQTRQLTTVMQPLFENCPWLQQRLAKILIQQQKAERWEKNKFVFAAVVAICLCIIIFLAARK